MLLFVAGSLRCTFFFRFVGGARAGDGYLRSLGALGASPSSSTSSSMMLRMSSSFIGLPMSKCSGSAAGST